MWKKLRKNYKRVIAFMLTMAMTFSNMAANMTAVFAAAGEEEEALFVVDGLELAQALREAKKSGEDFDYSSLDLKARTKKLKGQYEKMLKDGNVYQLEMEIDDSYAPDGTGMEVFYNEETDDVIFLFINGSDLVVNFRASIDGYETEPLTIGPNAANVELDGEEAADFIEDAATKLPEKEAPKAEVVGGTEAEDADGEAEDADKVDVDQTGEANVDESVDDEADKTEDQADAEENGEAEDQTEKETEAEEVESEEETTEEEVEAEEETEAEEPETEEEAEVEETEAEEDAEPEEDVPEEVAAVTVSLHEVQLVATDDNLEETFEEPETTEEEIEAGEQELEEEKDEDEDISEPAEEDEEKKPEKKEEAEAPETEKGTEAVDPKADDTTTSENKEEVADPENQGNISDSENGDQETADPEKQGDVTDAENPEEADGTEEGKTDETGEIPAEGTEAGETVAPADGTAPAETETTAPEEETKEDKIVKDDGEQFLDDTETMGVLEGKNFTAVALWENTMNAAAYRVSMEAMQVVLENIEIPEEPVGPTAYAAETDDASFTVEAPEGAFEEEVELHVEKIEDEDQLQNLSDQAAEAMDEKDSSKVVGFVAYDITFVSVETGEKVEPAVPVKVGMQFKTLPEEVKEEDVTGISVVHVPEEAMADAEETEEAVEAEDAEKPAAEVVETITGELDLSDVSFDAESFSPYVIYLNGDVVTAGTPVTDFASLQEAIKNANDGEIIEIKPEEDKTKEEAGSIVVTETLNIIDKNITIKGGELTRASDINIFMISNGGSLTLQDITLQGNDNIEIGTQEVYGEIVPACNKKSPVECGSGCELVLNNAAITGFHAERGGGVKVNGKLTLNEGARISGNTVYTGDTSYAAVGGGIYIDDGGMVIMNEGSEVCNNKAIVKDTTDQVAIGGGIAIKEGGSFTLDGGIISNNIVNGVAATSEGGGICIGSDHYTGSGFEGLGSPDGSKIKLIAGTISNNEAYRGGGIYVHYGVTLNLKDVQITDNECLSYADTYNPWAPPAYGGGIGFCRWGRAQVFDGAGALITNNKAVYGRDFGAASADWISIPEFTPNGVPYTWYQDCQYGKWVYDGQPIKDMGAWLNEFMDWSWSYGGETLGLRTEVDSEAYNYSYKLKITGNKFDDFGGGIACNGKIVFGDPTITPESPKLTIPVRKKWVDVNGETEITEGLPESIIVKLYRNKEEYGSLTLNKDNQWEGKFTDLLKADEEGNDYEYTIEEIEVTGWSSSVKRNQNDGFTITNTRIPTGNLIVSKTVTGDQGETNKEFNFTVTLDDTTINGTYGDMMFTNGVAQFSLKHGEKKSAEELPAGINYTVAEAEANQDGYETTVTGEAGEIQEDASVTAAFVNHKERDKGSLTVTKTVTGSRGDTTKEFTFTVTLSETITGTYGDMTFNNGEATFKLHHGQSATAGNLPAGITYTVTETDNDGYTVSATGEEGTIPANGTATAAFTNYRGGGGGGGSSDSSGGNPPSNPPTTTTTIDNPDVPLASLPNETPDPVSIEESEVPLAALLPKTGDSRNMSMWLMLFSVAGIGMLGAALGMKKKGNEDGDN